MNWDQSSHLHPDERFLTMVGTAVHIPGSFGQYINPATSPLNPANAGYSFFVYGMFPVTLNKVLAVLLRNDSYEMLTIQGRTLSGIADVCVVFLVYKIVQIFERHYQLPRELKYVAATVYALAVLPIQLAHFFAVDSFLNLFVIGAIYFALRYSFRPQLSDAVLSAALFGLALGSKASAVAIVPLIAALIALPLLESARLTLSSDRQNSFSSFIHGGDVQGLLRRAIPVLLVYVVTSYLVLRLADPYLFQSPSWLDPRLSSLFLSNLQQLSALSQPSTSFPPSVQWVHKTPVIFALVNLAVFGLGFPIFLGSVLGIYITVLRQDRARLLLLAFWTVTFFLYQSSRFATTMRYFIILYPFLAIFAAMGLYAVAHRARQFLKFGIAICVLIWPIAFMSIYTRPASRVEASQWMYNTLPDHSYMLFESWDDPLPVQLPNNHGKTLTGAAIPSFDPDAPAKWKQMLTLLKKGDYLVLSSNRGWGSIPTVPERYPRMINFYHDLFAGKTQYREVARFPSYPSLRYLGIPLDFPDQWSEEAFTVYDHPLVIVFEHIR